MTTQNECQMQGEYHQCCCQCVHHRPAYEHCTTNPALRAERGTCICSVQKGWACLPPECDGRLYDNWREHSVGCEMFTQRKKPA